MPRKYLSILNGIHMLPAYFVLFTVGVNFFFGALQLANSIKIDFFFAYMPKVVKLTIFSPSIDRGLWATSLIIILLVPIVSRIFIRNRIPQFIIFTHFIAPASCIVYLAKSFQQGLMFLTLGGFLALIMMIRYSHELLSLAPVEALVAVSISILVILISIQMGSLIVLILYPFLGPIFFATSPFQCLPKIHVHLFYVAYPLMMTFLVTLLVSWFWMPLLNFLIRATKRLAVRNQSLLRLSTNKARARNNFGSHRIVQIMVLFSLIGLSSFVIYYAHSFGKEPLGVDDEWYRGRLDGIASLEDLKRVLITEPRWPYLLLLYAIKAATSQNSIAVVNFGPVLLISLLSVTVYWLVNIGKNNRQLASLSSILTVFSMQTTVGLYTGIYANWLALSGMVAFFAFLLQALQKQKKKYIFLSIITSILVLLSHPWTWGILIGIIVCYSFITFLLLYFSSHGRSWDKRQLVYPLVIILFNLMFALIVLLMARHTPFISGAQSGIYSGYFDVANTLSIGNLLDFRKILSFTLAYYVGGLVAAPPIFLLAILGVWASRRYVDNFNRILLSWIIVPLMACFLTISFWQWRLLYLIPFQIPISIGVFFAIEKISQLYKRSSETSCKALNIFQLLLVASTILLAFNYALGSIVSFVGNLIIFQ